MVVGVQWMVVTRKEQVQVFRRLGQKEGLHSILLVLELDTRKATCIISTGYLPPTTETAPGAHRAR